MTSNDFYTINDMTAMLGVTRMTLYLWRHSKPPKGPPAIKLESGTVRYRKSRVHAWLKAMERGEKFDRRQGHMSIAKRRALEAKRAEHTGR